MARPRDEIEPEGGPAHQALNLLDALSVSLRRREEARLWRLRAGALSVLGPARDAEAVAAYQEAVLRAPRDGRLHWEAAVYHKWRGRWDEAWRLNAVALARMPSLRGALWTQAQLATVRGDAALATGIWRSLGHGMHAPRCGALPESQVQPTFLVRLPCRPAATGPSFEMLPLQATSPCHGVLTAPTFVAAGIDFGDQLLFDAAPAAWVQQAGVPVPCFPVVALLQRAQVRTLPVLLARADAAAQARWSGALPAGVLWAPRKADANTASTSLALQEGKLIVPMAQDLAQLCAHLETQQRQQRPLQCVVPSLYEMLGRTRQAGQAHQAWGAILRQAAKHARSAIHDKVLSRGSRADHPVAPPTQVRSGPQ